MISLCKLRAVPPAVEYLHFPTTLASLGRKKRAEVSTQMLEVWRVKSLMT